MHTVAQVNHRGLGVKVETNCLRNSDLIPCLKLGPNEKCVKGMQVRKQGGVRKCITYPIPGKIHAERQVLAGWVYVCGGGAVHNLRTGQIHAEGWGKGGIP